MATVVVLGTMGRLPFAGVSWQALHYLEGLRRLGHDVLYVEDTGEWPYDAERNTITDDPSYTLRYLADALGPTGFGDRWVYRAASRDGALLGPAADRFPQLWRRTDALVNLTGATVLREEHLAVPVRIYLETDPVLPQIEVAEGRAFTVELLQAHTHHFTFGENIGNPGCGVPAGPFRYHPTRQPVVLDWWQRQDATASPRRPRFTTIASWRQTGKDVEWRGEVYTWSKDVEFLKVLELPSRVSATVELALACEDRDAMDRLAEHGWVVVDALEVSRGLDGYRGYILGSDAEFTVAKDQNVRLRSGWFSDRSACYLAAGKPVVAQDTAFDAVLPVGKGLFAFRDTAEAAEAVGVIADDYASNQRAALEIAREYFDAERVLGSMLERAGVS